MPMAIEREPCPRRPAVQHCPQHFQEAHLVEPITGINERCSARLCILSEGLKGNWEPLSSSIRKLSRVVLRLLMNLMGSTS